MDLFLAKNGIYFNPFLGFYISFIPKFRDGSWGLIEVKLGDQEQINEGAANLLKIAKDIDEEKTGKPAFLMVITKNLAAIKREDGVYEIPLACLKP